MLRCITAPMLATYRGLRRALAICACRELAENGRTLHISTDLKGVGHHDHARQLQIIVVRLSTGCRTRHPAVTILSSQLYVPSHHHHRSLYRLLPRRSNALRTPCPPLMLKEALASASTASRASASPVSPKAGWKRSMRWTHTLLHLPSPLRIRAKPSSTSTMPSVSSSTTTRSFPTILPTLLA